MRAGIPTPRWCFAETAIQGIGFRVSSGNCNSRAHNQFSWGGAARVNVKGRGEAIIRAPGDAKLLINIGTHYVQNFLYQASARHRTVVGGRTISSTGDAGSRNTAHPWAMANCPVTELSDLCCRVPQRRLLEAAYSRSMWRGSRAAGLLVAGKINATMEFLTGIAPTGVDIPDAIPLDPMLNEHARGRSVRWSQIRAAIVGGSLAIPGGELLRLLHFHPMIGRRRLHPAVTRDNSFLAPSQPCARVG